MRGLAQLGLRSLDPTNSFVCQPVERRHGHREVFFFCVLDFVVTDAVEGLDEHHDGWDAGPGDFGGVVEGARGTPLGFGAGLGD
jgi:hypothetical protein